MFCRWTLAPTHAARCQRLVVARRAASRSVRRMIGGKVGLLLSGFGVINEETPAHVVLDKNALFEVRQYPPLVCATVSSADNNNRAFGILARYIGVFGTPANTGSAPLAMTAPVMSSKPVPLAMTAPVVTSSGSSAACAAGGALSFVLPSSIASVEAAPVPTDPRVVLEATPPRTLAARTFSGTATDAVTAQMEAALRADVAADARYRVVPNGVAQLARYNPPFCLSFMKTNEVLVEVEAVDGGATGADAVSGAAP